MPNTIGQIKDFVKDLLPNGIAVGQYSLTLNNVVIPVLLNYVQV